jgi:hypothetical protein
VVTGIGPVSRTVTRPRRPRSPSPAGGAHAQRRRKGRSREPAARRREPSAGAGGRDPPEASPDAGYAGFPNMRRRPGRPPGGAGRPRDRAHRQAPSPLPDAGVAVARTLDAREPFPVLDHDRPSADTDPQASGVALVGPGRPVAATTRQGGGDGVRFDSIRSAIPPPGSGRLATGARRHPRHRPARAHAGSQPAAGCTAGTPQSLLAHPRSRRGESAESYAAHRQKKVIPSHEGRAFAAAAKPGPLAHFDARRARAEPRVPWHLLSSPARFAAAGAYRGMQAADQPASARTRSSSASPRRPRAARRARKEPPVPDRRARRALRRSGTAAGRAGGAAVRRTPSACRRTAPAARCRSGVLRSDAGGVLRRPRRGSCRNVLSMGGRSRSAGAEAAGGSMEGSAAWPGLNP